MGTIIGNCQASVQASAGGSNLNVAASSIAIAGDGTRLFIADNGGGGDIYACSITGGGAGVGSCLTLTSGGFAVLNAFWSNPKGMAVDANNNLVVVGQDILGGNGDAIVFVCR